MSRGHIRKQSEDSWELKSDLGRPADRYGPQIRLRSRFVHSQTNKLRNNKRSLRCG